MNRYYSIAGLCLGVVFSFSVHVCAQSSYTGGDGSPENPFQIADFDDLTEMQNSPQDWDKYFLLIGDIDLDPALPGRQVYPRAVLTPATYSQSTNTGVPLQGTPFQGHFDGNGHSITNLHILGTACNGFFGWVGLRGRIRDLTVQGGTIEGNRFFGAVAAYNQGVIIRCQAQDVLLRDLAPLTVGEDSAGGLVGANSSGTVAFCHADVTLEGRNYAGGLVGNNTGAIYCCTSAGSVTGQFAVGGLVGSNTGSIQNCFSEGLVFGEDACGGIAGRTTGDIVNCYTVSNVTGNTNVGGIAGTESSSDGITASGVAYIANCYANGPLQGQQAGGVVGSKCPSPGCRVISCFWNTDTTGTSVTAGGGTGLTDDQARDPQVFLDGGWDFADETENGLCDDWYSPPGRQYPKLSFEHPQKATPIPFEGKGTPEKPYLIATASDLFFISGKPWLMDQYFKLISDVDLSEFILTQSVIAPPVPTDIVPVGDDPSGYFYGIPFLGIFDGDGYRIQNMFIDNYQSDKLGLFGMIESGVVKNLTLRKAKLYGQIGCGLLAGQLGKSGRLENCSVQGWLSGYGGIGGLVGYCWGDIAHCSFEGLVGGARDHIGGLSGIQYDGTIDQTGVSAAVCGRYDVGGLVGGVWPLTPDGVITGCYSKGAVTGSYSVGGLVGSNGGIDWRGQQYDDGQAIENCYSHARVSGTAYTGGLVGRQLFHSINFPREPLIPFPLVNSYFAGQVFQQAGCGGLTGNVTKFNEYAYGCYYDKEIIGGSCLTQEEWYGRTTAQMKSLDTYLATQGISSEFPWDFDTVWTLCEGVNYPRLRRQVPAGDWVCPDGVQLNDFAALAQCWMQAESFCLEKDLDQSGYVDAGELWALSENWLLDVEAKKDSGQIYFGFDEDAGTTVYSTVEGLTGTLCNMDESARQPGYFGKAIQFDGIDDSIVLEGFKGMAGGAARSCCAWVKTAAPDRQILSWGSAGDTGQRWVMRLDDQGRLSLGVGDGNKVGTSRINDGQWHHLAVVLNSDSMLLKPPPYPDPATTENLELFVDGQCEEIFSGMEAFIDTFLEYFTEIGVFHGAGQPRFFEGLMDEVKIIPYSLSLEEIRQMIPEEMVVHWKLDEGTGVAVHDSANGHDGVLMNMDESNWDAAENALYFDGVNEYVEFEDFKGLTGGKTRTCCAWIKTEAPGRQIITWGAAQPASKWVIRLNDDGRLRLEVGDGYRIGYRNIADGQWHHIAVTMGYDEQWPGVGPRCVALIVDGMQEPLAEVDGSLIYTSADENVKLGVHASNPQYFCGYMRDVRIYNYALPLEQIRQAMNMPEGTLVTHWKLDEGQGTIAWDAAGGYDGVLMNMNESSWDLTENALYFDGVDDYIEVPGFQGISGAQPRTCCAWIKAQAPGNQILTWGTVAPGAKWVIRLNEEGKVRVEVGEGYCIGSTLLSDDQWHHIAVKLDYSDVLSSTENIKIYVDGLPEIISESVSRYIQTAAAENIKIGVFSSTPKYFQGYLKDIRIYDYPLDIDQIHQIAGKGPVAHWKLDEGQGLTAADSAGEYDGALMNMTQANWDKSTGETALRFDGVGGYVDIPGFKGITGKTSRTCCTWVKTTTAGKQILSWGYPNPGQKWVVRVDDSGVLRVEVSGGWRLSAQRIDDGSWHHLAVVLSDDGSPDISEAILYVDGVESVGTYQSCPVNTAAGEDVKIGVYSTGLRYFNGLIRDVRVYDRALDSRELIEFISNYIIGSYLLKL